MNKGIVRFSTFLVFFAGAILLSAIYLGGIGGCGSAAAPVSEDECPGPFYSNFAPTLRASDITIIPTQMLTPPLSFNSTTSNGVITSNVVAGTSVFVASSLESLVGTVATLSGGPTVYTGTITPFTGPPTLLSVTDTILGSTVTPTPLAFADFGMSAITDDITGFPNSVITYSAFAGGTLPTPTMPSSGTSAYTGKITGVVADTVHSNATDSLNGKITLAVNFANGTITSGLLSNIAMAGGSGSFNNIGLIGTISGNGFSGQVTTGASGSSSLSMPSGEQGSTTGNFYASTANEIAGTFVITSSNSTQILIGSFGGSNGGPGSTGKGCATGPFYSSFAPTLQVSTQTIIPTVLQTLISFISTASGNSGTATVIAGPTGVTNDGVFTLANPSPGDPLVSAVATLPSSILLTSGIPALSMTATSLGSSVGLTSSDFGEWAITNDLASPLPTNSVITYSAYAGGTLPTSVMPNTGAPTYTGTMTGVLADTPVGGSDDVSGSVSLSINFSTGVVSGSVSGITTAAGVSTVVPYTTYGGGPFGNIALNGTIVGNSFSGTATTSTIAGATITTMTGHFYGSSGNEVTGTFTISDPSPGPGMNLIGSFGAK